MKKALIAGVNNYDKQKDLKGCENDARSFKNLLESQYSFTDIKLLLNEEVNFDSLTSSIKEILKPIDDKEEGVRVIFFAGHGGRRIDKNNDELDKIDETICLPNYDWEDETSFLIDDLLGKIINESIALAPNLRVYIILDSCHSGTATRDINFEPNGWKHVEQLCIKNHYASPFEIGVETYHPLMSQFSVARQAEEGEDFESLLEDVSTNQSLSVSVIGKGVGGESTSHLLLSGCKAQQTCKDVPIQELGIYHGIFTYTLIELLKSNPTLTPRQLQSSIENLIAETFMQNPQLEGLSQLKDYPIFT
jgi:hypothetical protein